MAFDPRQLTQLAAEHGTPLWVYDAAVIRERIAQLRRFDTIRYAQKACSNLHILRLMRAEGVVVDAVSEVLEIAAADIRPAPAFGSRLAPHFIAGMVKSEDGFLTLLDVAQVLDVQELASLAQAAS